MKTISFVAFLLLNLSAHAFTIGAYNIRNFDYDQRYNIHTDKPALTSILKSLNADVLSVEEINNSVEFELFIETNLPGYKARVSNCGGAHGQKLGFIYNSKTVEMLSFNEDLKISEPGQEGTCNSGSRPLAIALFKIKSNGQMFYGITAHLKSGSDPQSLLKRAKQFDVIKATVSELKMKSQVKDFYLAGDLNTTNYLNRGEDYKLLNKVVAELGMINLSSTSQCSAYWWGGSEDGIETPSLLDHVIVTPGLLKTQSKTESHGHCKTVLCQEVPLQQLGISYESVSDHCPVTANIQ